MIVSTLSGTSPLDTVLGPLGDTLPIVFRDQFLKPHPVSVRGTMDEIWYPKLFAPMFWLLGKVGILVPSTGGSVPTMLAVDHPLFGREFVYRGWFQVDPAEER